MVERERTPEDTVIEGRYARELLESEIFRIALEDLTRKLVQNWMRALDPEERESLWHRQKALAQLQKELEDMRDRGAIEERQRDPDTHDPRLGSSGTEPR